MAITMTEEAIFIVIFQGEVYMRRNENCTNFLCLKVLLEKCYDLVGHSYAATDAVLVRRLFGLCAELPLKRSRNTLGNFPHTGRTSIVPGIGGPESIHLECVAVAIT